MISFKKLKIFSGKISWNNMRSDLTVKWLSLISIKSEQVSKICSTFKRLSHPIHIGGSSPFNKKEWVIKEWPMCNRAITVSSFLFLWGQTIHSFSIGNILYNLFSGNLSHSNCHSSNIYLFVRDFRSENGMSSTEMSPSRASLAAESAAEFPLMPTWPGTQMKTISLPSLVISVYKSNIWTKAGSGAGIAQWLEHRTRDWKVAGSNPCWNGGRIFFSRVDFLCWLLFRYPFHPRVTTVARKKSRSFCQSAGGRLQLNTHTPYVCGFYWTVLRHWSQLVPNMSNDIWGH